jgi:hypothetical protein
MSDRALRQLRPDLQPPAGAISGARRRVSALVPTIFGVGALLVLAAVLLGRGDLLVYTPLAVMAACAIVGLCQPAAPRAAPFRSPSGRPAEPADRRRGGRQRRAGVRATGDAQRAHGTGLDGRAARRDAARRQRPDSRLGGVPGPTELGERAGIETSSSPAP